jgi:hypothetical protein
MVEKLDTSPKTPKDKIKIAKPLATEPCMASSAVKAKPLSSGVPMGVLWEAEQ